METGELQTSPDAERRIEGTIPVPLEPGKYLHLSTSRQQFSDFFEQYASVLGFDGKEAKDFFTNQVDISLEPINDATKSTPFSGLEEKLWAVFKRILHSRPLGEIAILKNGRHVISIDPKQIGDLIPNYTMGGKMAEYRELNQEGRIITLEAAITLVTMHELRHVLQFMHEPEKIEKMRSTGLLGSRIFIGGISTLPIALTSELTALGWAGGTLASLGYGIAKRGSIFQSDLESEVYDAVKKTDMADLKLSPFTFDVEVDSNSTR